MAGRHRGVAALRKILFACRQTRGPAPTAPLLAIELVDRRTEIAHRVTDEAFAAGRRDGGGYKAMCDAQVLPASLTAPARGHCAACDRSSAPPRKRVVPVETDSPDVVITKRLLDHAKLRGFEFRRVAPGEDGPLVGNRVSGDWVDLIHIEGFSRDCFAWRQRISSLIVPEGALVQRRVDGSALDVLNEVLAWEPRP